MAEAYTFAPKPSMGADLRGSVEYGLTPRLNGMTTFAYNYWMSSGSA